MARQPLNQAELVQALNELREELQQARQGIGTDALQGVIGSVQGGMMGMIRASIQVPLNSLGRSFSAKANELNSRADLAARQGFDALADKLRDSARNLEGLSQAASGLSGVLGTMVDTVTSTARTMISLASLASPSAGSTFEGNVRLAQAKAGKHMEGDLNNLSKLVYALGEAWDRSGAGKTHAEMMRLLSSPTMELVNRSGLASDMPQDVVSPTQARMTTSRDYSDALTIASLNASGQQTQQRLLQLQLEQLAQSGNLLKEIKNNTAPKPGGWRA